MIDYSFNNLRRGLLCLQAGVKGGNFINAFDCPAKAVRGHSAVDVRLRPCVAGRQFFLDWLDKTGFGSGFGQV
jgi:hypothetical protein